MWKYIFYFYLFPGYNSEILDDLSKFITKSFNSRHCVHFLGTDNLLFKAIQGSYTAITLVNIENMDKSDFICKSTGYIISFNSKEPIISLFRSMLLFQPYNRILIICDGFTPEELFEAVSKYPEHALGVSFINLIQSNESKLLLPPSLIGYNITEFNRDLKLYFGKTPLKVLIFDYRPFIFVEGTKIYGFEKHIMDAIMDGWPTENVVFPPFNWDEVIDGIEFFRGNISFASHWLLHVARHNLDITQLYTDLSSIFLVSRPKLKPRYTMFYQPFNGTLWILLLITLLVFAKFLQNIYKIEFNKNKFTYEDFILISFAILLLNSTTNLIPKFSQFILLLWSTGALLFSSAYSSGYSSLLTVPEYEKHIRSHQDLFESKYTCYLSSPSSLITANASPSYFLRKLTSKITVTRDNLKKPSHCMLGDVIFQTYVLPQFDVDVFERGWELIEEKFQTTNVVVILNKNSPYTRIFNKKLSKLVENGLVPYWWRMEVVKEPNLIDIMKIPKQENEGIGMNIIEILGPLALLATGCTLGTACFIFEKLVLKDKFRRLFKFMKRGIQGNSRS